VKKLSLILDNINFKFQSQSWGLFGIVLFRIFLDLNYRVVFSEHYGYMNFESQVTFWSYLISWIILLVPVGFILNQYLSERTFFANVVVLFYLFGFIPGTSLMAFMPMDFSFVALFASYWFLLFFFSCSFKSVKTIVLPTKISKLVLYGILLIISVSVIYVWWNYAGGRILNIFYYALDMRLEARTWELPTILRYALTIAMKVLPFLLVYFLWQKKKILPILIILVILFNFSIGGNRSVLFYLLLALLGYWLYNEKRIALYSWVLSFVSATSLLEYVVGESYRIGSLIMLRVLYFPALLNYMYYDFFSMHEFDYFRQSFLRHFGVTSPYKEPISTIIGAEYFNRPEMNANNGFFSDAYLNLGIIGIFIFPFLIVLLLKIIDATSRGLNPKLLAVPILVVFGTIMSIPLTTALLTGGIIVLVFCLLILPRNHIILYKNNH